MEPLRISENQARLAQLIGQGLTDKQIAERLGLTTRAVNNALSRLYRRLGVSGRDQAYRAMLAGYSGDARPLLIPPGFGFGPDEPADISPLVGSDGKGGLLRRWRKPPRGVLNRAGLVLGLSLIWILLFAGALPAVLHVFERVQDWWVRF